MNVLSPEGSLDDGDLTGRARIRLAALRQFAEHGFAGASMRRVADAAGVSVGLVQHHFGSKAALREECDAYVVNYVRAALRAGIEEHRLADADFLVEIYRDSSPVSDYLVRSLGDGSPGAAALFDELVAMAREQLPGDFVVPGTDGDTVSGFSVAVVLTAMKLGVTLLRTHLDRALHLGENTEAMQQEISRALLAIISPEVTGPSIGKLAGRGLTELSKRERKNDGD